MQTPIHFSLISTKKQKEMLLKVPAPTPSKENAHGTSKAQKYWFCIVKLMLIWGGADRGFLHVLKVGGRDVY